MSQAINKQGKASEYNDKSKPAAIRASNMAAAKAVCDALRTSLGPRGMDKVIISGKGDAQITNDGATILKEMKLLHPAAKMLVDLSRAQDIEAGDGTTTVVVLAGSLLDSCAKLLQRGIHPTIISDALQTAVVKCTEILEGISTPVDLNNKEQLIHSAVTSLNSKVVSQQADKLAPISVEAVMRCVDPATPNNVNLNDIRVVKKVGGTVDDCELIEGLILNHKAASLGGVKRMEKAKIGLIQFCISPPKTDMESNIIVSDYQQMDRVLKEERTYILNIVKQIKKSGCNVLLVQKSILRDALTDVAIHFLDRSKILVVNDVERDEIEFTCKTLNCKPIASLDHFTADMLGSAELVEEIQVGNSKIVKVSGIVNPGRTVSLLVRGSNKLVLDEAERSIHDALCVVRCLVKKRGLLAGGGAPEIELSLRLSEYANTLTGMQQYCVKAFAEAMEIVPYTLAENAGMHAIQAVTELRAAHAAGHKTAGVNVKRAAIGDIMEENVLQPLLVTVSAVSLAAETVRSILKIDDVITAVRGGH